MKPLKRLNAKTLKNINKRKRKIKKMKKTTTTSCSLLLRTVFEIREGEEKVKILMVM